MHKVGTRFDLKSGAMLLSLAPLWGGSFLLIPPLAVGLGVVFLDEQYGNEIVIGFGLIGLGLIASDGRFFNWVRRSISKRISTEAK